MRETPNERVGSFWDVNDKVTDIVTSAITPSQNDRGAAQQTSTRDNTDETRLVTVKELSRRYGLSLIAVYGLIKTDSSFPAVNVGLRKKYMIDLNKFNQWLDQRAISTKNDYVAKTETMASLRKLFKERK